LAKILLLAIAIWLLLKVLKGYRRSIGAEPPVAKTSDMVRCERCGVHVPVSESFLKDGKHYCCEAHSAPAGQ